MTPVFIAWALIGAAGALLSLAGYLAAFAWRGRYGMARDRFLSQCRADGMNVFGANDELELREELARLRTIASDRVIAAPADWIAILDEEKAAGVKRLAYRRDLARRFSETVRDLPYTHILYPDAVRAANATIAAFQASPPTDHEWAALNIVRPS